MPSRLSPPRSLNHLPYFILRYRRSEQKYELLEPHSSFSYDLGNAFQTREYFRVIGLEHLGGRAMDSALAFGASQAWLKGEYAGLAYGLDLCKTDLDHGIVRQEDVDDQRRLLDDEEDEDFVFVSGTYKVKVRDML